MKIKGKYTEAVVMIDNIEDECINQILEVCNQKFMSNSKIRIMPDTHLGKGICVGFTALVEGNIPPNFIGVDISCSVSAYKLDCDYIDFEKLDNIIRKRIPGGFSVRNEVSRSVSREFKEEIYDVCSDIGDTNNYERHLKSLGTLGGGNHFIEINKGFDGKFWLVVHTGSRNFGHKICSYHQKIASEKIEKKYRERREYIINNILGVEIEEELKKLKNSLPEKNCSFLGGDDLSLYIKHMKVAQKFAKLNHKIISEEIISNLGLNVIQEIMTNHNYIESLPDGKYMIRKGSVSAKKDELIIIPLNMRDGSMICVGKGNDEWNCSAPHGAGRILSRTKAKEKLCLHDFESQMVDVWTSCISKNTLDESPMAYKDKEIIINSIGDTADIIDIIKPFYNYKAS